MHHSKEVSTALPGSVSFQCGPHGRFPAQATLPEGYSSNTNNNVKSLSAFKEHTKCASEWFLRIVFNSSPLHMQSKRWFKDICRFLDQLFEITGFDTRICEVSFSPVVMATFCLFAQIHSCMSPWGRLHTWDSRWAHLILDTFMLANCKS